MKIYLDSCCLQRPLDDRTQLRISLESEAVLGLLKIHERKGFQLISSEVLFYETINIPNMTRREFTFNILSKADIFVRLNDTIIDKSKQYVSLGLKPLDSLHIAVAEFSDSDYFCTSDDKLLKICNSKTNLKVKVINPVDLLKELFNAF